MTKKIMCLLAIAILLLLPPCLSNSLTVSGRIQSEQDQYADSYAGEFIKWVDFNASLEMLKKVYSLDVKYHDTDIDFKFTKVLAYLATKNGNKFSVKTDKKNLNALVERLEKGETVDSIMDGNKYYKYYLESYNAIFSEFIGKYRVEGEQEIKYGLRAYSPIASGYYYSDYDDFGNKRSYGYKRIHLGHDLMGSIGTPIVAIEGGVITELGWNRYGGWRVGIRSFDTKRYYYYAHLRKNRPFAANLSIGDSVRSGQVIGYMGMTGYSTKENTNMQTGNPHLHLGLQLIFDKSQEDGSGEIWIDMYAITQFLSMNKARVVRDETKEYHSTALRIPK